jgi:hypothetical protein
MSWKPFLAVSILPLDTSIMDSLKHKCFLEELLFWTIKYEFPQKMVTFLLNMLPDQDYKVGLYLHEINFGIRDGHRSC